MDIVQHLHRRLDEYDRLTSAVCDKYRSGRGVYGELAPLETLGQIRHLFVRRTRGCFRFLHHRHPIVKNYPVAYDVAYYAVKQLLRHPVAQEIELMTETVN